MTFTSNVTTSVHDFAQSVNRSDHECEKNVETQFTSPTSGACGGGVKDRIASDGQGRTTSEGECRIIA